MSGGTTNGPPIVAVTGGIGAGKTTVCRLLADLHQLPVVDADTLGHEALTPGSSVYEAVIARFGEDLKGRGGSVKRSLLAERVFSDPRALADLNGLVHPWILERILARRAALKASGHAGIILLDAALVLDWLSRYKPEGIILVQAPIEVRVARLERRGLDRNEALRRIGAQPRFLDGAEAPAAVDWTVVNDGDRALLRARVEDVWRGVAARFGCAA